MPHFRDLDLKKRINRRKTTWQNGDLVKRTNGFVWCEPDDHPFFQNYSFHQIFFVLFILFFKLTWANWLVRHSIPFPNQQWRPLPSLLSDYYSTALAQRTLLYRSCGVLSIPCTPPTVFNSDLAHLLYCSIALCFTVDRISCQRIFCLRHKTPI